MSHRRGDDGDPGPTSNTRGTEPVGAMSLEEESSIPEGPLDELVFLARSRHRIRLLVELDRTQRSRQELLGRTDISQPTLGRILADFEERNWVRNHHNGAYSLTSLGVLLADVLEDLLEALGTTGDLADVLEHLPLEELELYPLQLATTGIVTPSSEDPLAHMRRFDELAELADHVRVFSNVLACAPTAEPSQADMAFLSTIDELVVTADAVETGLKGAELRGTLHDSIADGSLTVYTIDLEAPFLYGIFDDVGGLVPIDDAGVPQALLEADSPAILEWLEATFGAHRNRARRLTAADLAE